MPRIPQFLSEKLPPGTSGGVPMSPDMSGLTGRALAGLGNEVEKSGKVFDAIYEKERQANDAIEATKMETALRAKELELSERLRQTSDYSTIEDDTAKWLEDVKTTLTPKNPSRGLAIAFEKSYQNLAFHSMSITKAKKYDLMNEQGKVAFGDVYSQALKDYAKEPDPEKRNIIKNELKLKGYTLQKANAVDPVWIESVLDKFDAEALQYAKAEADVQADKMIEEDATKAKMLLKDPSILPDLDIKVRQDKIEKAIAAEKVKQHELETKEKEVKKIAHDDEERNIALLYHGGEYAKAFSAVGSSKVLSPNEIKTWTDSIKEKAKSGDNVSDDVVASEIVKINSMISKGENPDKIKAYIVRTPKLKKEDREQYLSKLESKISKSEDEGIKLGYKDIESIIIPKRGAFTPLMQTPNETRSVMKAQMALDEWVNKKRQDGKYLSATEIRKQAQSFAEQMQISVAEKVEEIETTARKAGEEAKKAQEDKLKVKTILESDRKRIETELKNNGLPITNSNILKVYELNSKGSK